MKQPKVSSDIAMSIVAGFFSGASIGASAGLALYPLGFVLEIFIFICAFMDSVSGNTGFWVLPLWNPEIFVYILLSGAVIGAVAGVVFKTGKAKREKKADMLEKAQKAKARTRAELLSCLQNSESINIAAALRKLKETKGRLDDYLPPGEKDLCIGNTVTAFYNMIDKGNICGAMDALSILENNAAPNSSYSYMRGRLNILKDFLGSAPVRFPGFVNVPATDKIPAFKSADDITNTLWSLARSDDFYGYKAYVSELYKFRLNGYAAGNVLATLADIEKRHGVKTVEQIVPDYPGMYKEFMEKAPQDYRRIIEDIRSA